MHPLRRLEELGQSIWYDNISRNVLLSGEMQKMVDEGLLGVTSNPTIFEKAIAGGTDYDADIRGLLMKEPEITDAGIVQALMVKDIRMAADLFRAVFTRTGGRDGYISIEVNPALARDTAGTVREARELWQRVHRPNVMVKIPATKEGLPAIVEATAEGINVNVTLIFSVERYREVALAYMAGLERRLAAGQPVDGVRSVASVFVSRVDTLVDELLEAKIRSGMDAAAVRPLLGKAAVANTVMVYQEFKRLFFAQRFGGLRARGAHLQRPLWGSTSTKNPAYPDLLYVEPLVGPDTVNTVPPQTYAAVLDHARPALTIEKDFAGAEQTLRALAGAGIDMAAVLQELEDDGVAAFMKSFEGLSRNISQKRNVLLASL